MKSRTQLPLSARVLKLLSPWTTPLDPSVLLRTFTATTHPQPRTGGTGPTDLRSQAPVRTATPIIGWGADHVIDADPDDVILDTLEAAGLEPTFGCRRGVCRRCVVPLESGCVRDRRDERDIDAGTHIRICVTSPLTDIHLDPDSPGTPDSPASPRTDDRPASPRTDDRPASPRTDDRPATIGAAS